jgi:hypothetical protein
MTPHDVAGFRMEELPGSYPINDSTVTLDLVLYDRIIAAQATQQIGL